MCVCVYIFMHTYKKKEPALLYFIKLFKSVFQIPCFLNPNYFNGKKVEKMQEHFRLIINSKGIFFCSNFNN